MSGTKLLAKNRRAFHEYEVEEKLECGIALEGTEVKSIRDGKLSFSDSYGRIRNGELWLIGFHVAEYKQGNIYNHEPLRDRKLLVHREEIKRLKRKVDERGYTLVPLSIYLKGDMIKVEMGLCKGKKLYDKREDLKRKAQKRDAERELRGRY
jgi:SsrA-binding protein